MVDCDKDLLFGRASGETAVNGCAVGIGPRTNTLQLPVTALQDIERNTE